MQEDPLEQKLREIIIGKIEGDSLALPSMPSVAASCLGILRNPRADMADVSREIERDPITAAYVLRLANSAAMRSRVIASTVAGAVSRLGTENLRTLFLHMSARTLFESRDPRITRLFLEIWRHSIAVALLARDLSAVLGRADSNVAYEAGLLHDIGKPVIAMMLIQFEKSAKSGSRVGLDSDLWLRAVENIHRHVAVSLARKWKLPETISQCIENGTVYDETDTGAASNIVRLANCLAKRAGIYTGEVDEEETQTLIRLGQEIIGVQGGVLERLQQGIRARTDEVVAI